MDLYEIWTKALKNTEILRSRAHALQTFKDTAVPYTILSASSVNPGDTVVRSGEIMVEKPMVVVPPNVPQFEGFEFKDYGKLAEDYVINFLLVRGVSLPSFRYNNKTCLLDVFEGDLSKAIAFYQEQFQRREDVHGGLIVGPEDCWQFSLLIYICSQITRNAEGDIKRILEQYRSKKDEGK